MYSNRLQSGKEFVYVFLTRSPSFAPLAPSSSPVYTVMDSGGNNVITNGKAISIDFPRFKGIFEVRFLLDQNFTAGSYSVNVTWASGGSTYAEVISLEVLPGGSFTGQVTSCVNFVRPNANYIINARDSGSIFRGKNPTEQEAN